MRTPAAAIQTAMDNFDFGLTVEILVCDADPDNFTQSIQPISFEIGNITAKAKIENSAENLLNLYIGTIPATNLFAIRRTITTAGNTYTVTTPTYFAFVSADAQYLYLEGNIFPPTYQALGANYSYSDVMNAIVNFDTLALLNVAYEYPANPVWTSPFLPAGRNVVLNPASQIETMLRQKYLIGLRIADNTLNGLRNVYLFHPTKTRSADYTISYDLYRHPAKEIKKKLIWRDETNSTGSYTPAEIELYGYTIHNLGYIDSSISRPDYLDAFSTEKTIFPGNLKYQTGDRVTFVSAYAGTATYTIDVLEKFSPDLNPPWQMEISAYPHFSGTEGGALPSTIEAAAPYTPLNVSNFDRFLTAAVNNLQAFADWVNDFAASEALLSTLLNALEMRLRGRFQESGPEEGEQGPRGAPGVQGPSGLAGQVGPPGPAGRVIYLTNDDYETPIFPGIPSAAVRKFLPFGVYANLSPMSATSDPYSATVDRQITLISWAQMVYVATTSDASNYWTITLLRITDGATVNQITTATATANVAKLITDTSFSINPLQATDVGIYMHCVKTGAPGNLYLFGPLVEIETQ